MKIKIGIQKILKPILTALVYILLNMAIGVLVAFIVIFIWAVFGEDNDYFAMKKISYLTGICFFVLTSLIEIIRYLMKRSEK